MADQNSWSAWIADLDGYCVGDLNANGVSETFAEFAARVGAGGQTATEKGLDPTTTRPPDRPKTTKQLATDTKRTRLAELRATDWSRLTKAQQQEATDLAFCLKEPVPAITATA